MFGDLYIGEQCMNDVELFKCGVGMVFQFYVFYLYFNLYDNMLFGFKFFKVDKSEIKKCVDYVVEIL